MVSKCQGLCTLAQTHNRVSIKLITKFQLILTYLFFFLPIFQISRFLSLRFAKILEDTNTTSYLLQLGFNMICISFTQFQVRLFYNFLILYQLQIVTLILHRSFLFSFIFIFLYNQAIINIEDTPKVLRYVSITIALLCDLLFVSWTGQQLSNSTERIFEYT